MWFPKLLLTIWVMTLTLAHFSLAEDSPEDNAVNDTSANSPEEYLRVHNAARAEVGVGPMTWNTTLEAYAQNYANERSADCELKHSDGPYGENIAEASYALTAAEAVKLWVDEKVNYNYDTNECTGGGVCGHYTQVVWRNSIHLGCARVNCKSGWWFVTCNYDPPGNYVGERPY